MVQALPEKKKNFRSLGVLDVSPFLPITFRGFSVWELKTPGPRFPNPLLMFPSAVASGLDGDVWNYIFDVRRRPHEIVGTRVGTLQHNPIQQRLILRASPAIPDHARDPSSPAAENVLEARKRDQPIETIEQRGASKRARLRSIISTSPELAPSP